MNGLVDPRFENGVALVAGGSGAIGQEIALGLARLGSDVAVSYRGNRAAAEGVACRIRELGRHASTVQMALDDSAVVHSQVQALVAEFGSIHSVAYASGPALRMEPIAEISPAHWAEIMALDANGCFNLVHATLPHVRAAKGAYVGVITAAVERVPARDILSAAPKAAIEMLMRGVAKEEGRNGVRANCVAPGWIGAGVGKHFMENELSAEQRERVLKAIPLGRAGTAAEVADAALFLLSSRASFVTGQTIAVDGGMQV